MGWSYSQLVFLLSTLLDSILSLEHKIFIALDEKQWVDPTTTMIGLVSEVLVTVHQGPEKRHCLVLVGMNQGDEITSDLLLFKRAL